METINSGAPLVSIGLPTHNGQRYIREALDSLLAQDYPNFEIVVSDNASTDGTLAIVEDYAARDGRMRVIRQDVNIGAPANFNLVFHETTGPFFMWAADDDRWGPTYVSACVSALQATPTAVLACTRVVFVDEHGMPKLPGDLPCDNPDLSAPSVGSRVHLFMSRFCPYAIYGVIRRDALSRTRLLPEAFGGDVVLLLQLALLGPFTRVPVALAQTRLFESRTEPDRGAWHDAIPDRERVQATPWSYLQETCSQAIAASSLGRAAKSRAWLAMARAAFLEPTWLREAISGEVDARFCAAVRERDVGMVFKYAVLKASIAFRRRRPRRKVGSAAD